MSKDRENQLQEEIERLSKEIAMLRAQLALCRQMHMQHSCVMDVGADIKGGGAA